METREEFVEKFSDFFDRKEMLDCIERGVVNTLKSYGCTTLYGCNLSEFIGELNSQDGDLDYLEEIRNILENFEEYLNGELSEIEVVKEDLEDFCDDLNYEELEELEVECSNGKYIDIRGVEKNIKEYFSELDSYFDLLNTWKAINEEQIEYHKAWLKEEREEAEMER
ncbi:hypothetical protein [Streptobacillus moniliformis]|uniref:hypothetical protein n=1 Tax=Streptobacillus moniliformis TaxID=34105 RepID=UPI0007E329B2|nr:hypothetical protein [Streptobacillus moniliformis]